MSNELERLQAELESVRAMDAATADILRIIRETPGDLEAALTAIGRSVEQLCDSESCAIRFRFDETPGRAGQRVWTTLSGRISQAVDDEGVGATLAAFETNQPIQMAGPIEQWEADYPTTARAFHAMGYREVAFIAVPMAGPLGPIGAISTMRGTARPFGADELDRLERFGAQAAIAIENTRRFLELRESDARTREALDVQRVMAHVLGIVAGAPSNLESSLPEIAAAAKQLTGADTGVVFVFKDNRISFFSTARGSAVDADGMARWSKPEDRSLSSVAIFENRIVEVAGPIDTWAAEYPRNARMMIAGGASEAALLAVPLPALPGNDGAAGSILVTRGHATPFTETQRAILFALGNQAVIAIQNARLFGELQARNTEITEALKREKAGSAILRQISESPEKLEETLQAIADASLALTGCTTAVWKREGQESVLIGAAFAAHEMPAIPIGLRQRTTKEMEIAIQSRSPALYQVTDNRLSEQLRSNLTAAGETTVRNLAYVPVVSAGEVTAVLVLANCEESAVPLFQSFADQAAIAIENARLIRELRDSNQTISENLDRQTIMRNVLAIIASAPSDLDATLPQVAAAAKRLCEADFGGVTYIDGDAASAWDDQHGARQLPLDTDGHFTRGTFVARCVAENQPVEVIGPVDEWESTFPNSAKYARLDGRNQQAVLAVPIPGANGAIGAILVIRNGTRPFTERNRTSLEALANQAVIAIENARLFNQLQAKTQELEVASRHKSEFLANMSHELRTPLNAIIGYAELLQEECEDLGQQEFIPDLGKIHSAGKHLLTLISGILDLSKVEAGRMTMFLEDFDISTLIRDADAIVRPLVEKNSNTFVIDCPDDIGVMHADLVKVRQVLFNLLSNAAKFTQNGTITLSVRSHTDDDTIHMAITDTGIGMTEEQLGRLFEAFSQASAETSRKYGGTGLGLALSREFCRMMGGEIAVTSQHGLGSTFTILLPRTCVPMEDVS